MTHFTVLVILTTLVATATLATLARRAGEPVAGLVAPILFLATTAILGAKGYALWLRYDGSFATLPSWNTPGSLAGFRHPGGVLGLLVGMIVLAASATQRRRLPRLADWVAIAICVATAVFRINCFLDGCCAGRVCTAAWCQLAGGPARHPLALYFLAWAAGVGLLLIWFERRKQFDGQVALLYLAIHETGKIALETLRLPEVPYLRQPSLILAVTAALGLLLAHRRAGRVLIAPAAAAMLTFGVVPTWAPDAGAGSLAAELHVAGDRISGRLAGVPANDALGAIAEAARAEVVGTVRNAAPVDLELQDESIAGVLPRLLAPQGFALVYRKDGSIRRITIHDRQAPDTLRPGVARTAPKATFSLPPPPPAMLAYRVRPASDGALADLVGRSDVAVSDLMRFALQHDDPQVRADALRTGLRALGRIPGARAWLRDTFAAVARHPMSAFRAALDPAAREALAGVVASGRDDHTRTQAAELLGDDDAAP